MEQKKISMNHSRRRSPLSSSNAGVAIRQRRRTQKADAIDNFHTEVQKEFGGMNLSSNEDDTNSDMSQELKQFRKSTLATSQASFWSKPNARTLVKHVVSNSLSLFKKRDCSSSLLLESLSSELLSSCRVLVKEATEEDKRRTGMDNTVEVEDLTEFRRVQYNRLFVATHGLRSLLCTQLVNDAGKRDVILRLFYFCIVTSSSTVSACDSFVDTKYLCFSAYHALAHILQNYTLSRNDVAFTCGTAQRIPLDCTLTFPVPIPAKKKPRVNKNSTDADQICTMCIAANLCMARIVSRLVRNDADDEENCGFNHLPFTTTIVPIDFLRYIVLDVTVPWIACVVKILCVANQVEPRHQNNILSNCKKAHRVLVDIAETILDQVEIRLEMQKSAIFALLLNQNVAPSMLVPDATSEHSVLAAACTFAWKVAESTHAQLVRNNTNKGSSPSLLQAFHDPVGTLLDSFTKELEEYPFSYVEYCAYRAIHTYPTQDTACTDTGCPFRELPYRFQHSCSLQRLLNYKESFLAFFFLVRQTCRSLEHALSSQLAPSGEVSTFYESQILTLFRMHFVDGNDVDSSTRLRCHNILCSVSLHRVIHRIVNESRDHIIPHKLLETSGMILSYCIGPFCLGLLHQVNERQRRQLWFTMASCFQQAISVEELNVSSNRMARSNKLSEELMKNLLLVPNQTLESNLKLEPPSECLENTAKFLYSVGKKRFEGGKMSHALLPLLHSVRLLVHLATAKAPDTIPNLKISNRFALISSIYRSLNMLDEAILATTIALLFDAVEESFTATACCNWPASLLSWLASMTENTIDAVTLKDALISEQRRGLLGTYINLFLKRTKVNRQIEEELEVISSGLTPMEAIDLLLASLNGSNACDTFEQNYGLPFNLGSLTKSIFSCQISVSSFSKDYQYAVHMELFKISVDMIFRVGSVLQGKGKIVSSVNLSDHADLCMLAESLLRLAGTKGTINTDMLGAMINIVASVSMVSSHSYFNLESLLLSQAQGIRRKEAPFLNLAQDYAARAKTMLGKALEKHVDLDPTAFSVDLALDLYSYQLSRMRLGQNTSFQLKFKRLMSFIGNIQEGTMVETSFGLAWIHCLRSTLSKLCGMFLLEGEGLLSLQIAKWNHDVCTTCHCDVEGQIWSESVLLSLLSTNSVVAQSDFENANGSIALETLVRSCRLRLFIRSLNDKADLLVSQNRFVAILDDLKKSEGALEHVLQYIVLWTRSTIFLGLAECSERQGQLQMSRDHVRRCFETCKDLCAAMKRDKVSLSSGASSHPFWMRASVSLILLHCSQRQTECLLRIANLQSRLGDYRQSVEHSFSALMTPALDAAGLDLKRTFAESVALTRSFPVLSSQEALCRRVFLRCKSKASPQDLVSDVFRTHDGSLFLSIFDSSVEHGDIFVNHALEQILDLYEIVEMKNGYQEFTAPIHSMTLHKSATKDFIRYRLTPQVSKIYDTVTLVAGCGEQPCLQLQYDAKLRDASIVLSCDSSDSLEASATAKGWLHDIVSAPNCESLCRSWSYYLLGSLSLKSARRNGDLSRKWNDHEPFTNSSQFLSETKKHFENALALLGSSCDILKRNVLRSLALVNGPGKSNKNEARECFRLVNASVGGSVKIRMLESISESENFGADMDNIFESLENIASETDDSKSSACFLHELGSLVPKEWRFVTAALSPSGELLLSSLDFSEFGDPVCNNACVGELFFQKAEHSSKDYMYDFIVKPLKEIVHRSQAQLSDDRNTVGQDENTRQDQTRKWWNTRRDLDSDLQEHIENVERALLSSDEVRRVLCGLSFDRESSDYADEGFRSTRGNLTSRFDAVSLSDDTDKSKSYTASQQSACEIAPNRKAKSRRFDTNFRVEDSPDVMGDPNTQCTFLILDETLFLFPFEGFQCFQGKAICRIPSIPFLLAKLSRDGADGYEQRSIHPEKTSYILDPESNLAGTKNRMAPFITSLQENHDYSWRGVVGEPPSDEFMEDVLSQRDGLLLYFGHGGGQQFFSRAKIESLGQRSDHSLASLILMGCGSGRLESVNTKKSKSISNLPIHYEPEGIALSYLLAGSPCVVGNLWDVTDRDIDRYSVALLESILDGTGDKSIAKCVAESRAACKLRYIVGCAPVCYGIPVIARKHKKE